MDSQASATRFRFGLATMLLAIPAVAFLLTLVRESELDKILNGKTEIQFANTPIRHAVDFVAHKHNFQWRVDESEIKRAGKSLDSMRVTGSANGLLSSVWNARD